MRIELITLRYPDAYHSCYTLAGLSSAQHYMQYTSSGSNINSQEASLTTQSWAPYGLAPAEDNGREGDVSDSEDRLTPIHPIYVIPFTAVERCNDWCAKRCGF